MSTTQLSEATTESLKQSTNDLNQRKSSPAVVSKDDIEMMRGRALSITDTDEQRSKQSGVLYVTAPTMEMMKPKMGKSFGSDLRDVSMDDEDEPFDTHKSKEDVSLKHSEKGL